MSPLRDHAISIWQAAVAAADPSAAVRRWLDPADNPARAALRRGGRVFVCGAGKAGAAMAEAVEAALAEHLDHVSGVVNVPAGPAPPLRRIRAHAARPAGSNHPTAEGVAGAELQLSQIAQLSSNDLGLCLLSGGGSALLPAPVAGVSLADKQHVTRLLHGCGATIDEMNCVRKHLSRVKGGRLAEAFAARGCPVHGLLISDVVGDPLDVIASGPTAPDPTTFAEAIAVLERYGLVDEAPPAVLAHLRRGAAGAVAETPKRPPAGAHNHLLCRNREALAAAAARAAALGYGVVNLGSYLEGETSQLGVALAGVVRSVRADGLPISPPACLLSGGETTVTLGPSPGRGGRNQELVLALLVKLGEAGMAGVAALSGGTDGEDGPTDAAGAVGDVEVLRRARGLDARAHLERHDAYPYFEAGGGLVKTGLTGTNVMDVRVVLVGA